MRLTPVENEVQNIEIKTRKCGVCVNREKLWGKWSCGLKPKHYFPKCRRQGKFKLIEEPEGN